MLQNIVTVLTFKFLESPVVQSSDCIQPIGIYISIKQKRRRE